MKVLIDEAKQYIQREVEHKNDVFITLCSLNLLNAAIKDKEYKELFWAIPTSRITENKNMDRINKYINSVVAVGGVDMLKTLCF